MAYTRLTPDIAQGDLIGAEFLNTVVRDINDNHDRIDDLTRVAGSGKGGGVVRKKLIVDDISSILYDGEPISLAAKGITSQDTVDFLNGDLSVEISANTAEIFGKLSYPGLYKVYTSQVPDWLRNMLSKLWSLKFDTSNSQIFYCDTLYNIANWSEWMSSFDPELPEVSASAAVQNTGHMIGSVYGTADSIMAAWACVLGICLSEHFHFKPIKCFLENRSSFLWQHLTFLTAVSEESFSLIDIGFPDNDASILDNYAYSLLTLDTILRRIPKNSEYSYVECFTAIIDYLQNSYSDEMQSLVEYHGFDDYNTFRYVFENTVSYLIENSGDSFIGSYVGANTLQSLIAVMRGGSYVPEDGVEEPLS